MDFNLEAQNHSYVVILGRTFSKKLIKAVSMLFLARLEKDDSEPVASSCLFPLKILKAAFSQWMNDKWRSNRASLANQLVQRLGGQSLSKPNIWLSFLVMVSF